MGYSVYDVAIIGLGPAGATLARLLSKELRVVAIDKKPSEEGEGFKKVCGGLLAPDAQKAMAKFGLTLPLDVMVNPQIFSVRTIDVRSGIVRHYQRHYMNLDRDKFDRWLISLISDKVDLIQNVSRTQIFREDDHFRIVAKYGEYERTVSARYVIGADGATSVVRNTFNKKVKIKQYIAIQEWFVDRHESPFYSSIFDPDTTDCYAWGLSKNGRFIFGGAFEINSGRDDYEKLKAKLVSLGFSLENPEKTEACLVLRPSGPKSFCCGDNGVFLIGEAAGFISPSSLEGISYAFTSASILADILNSGASNPNARYRRATSKIRMKILLKNLKMPFMYNPFLRKLVMKSGLASIKMIDCDDE